MKGLRDSIRLLLLAALPALLAGWLHPHRPTWSWTQPAVNEVSVRTVRAWPTAPLWVDARSATAYRQQHIPGAVLCNEDAWESLLPGFLEAWQPGTKIVVYCDAASCAASQSVALRLQRELNLPDIYVLQGGWTAWQQTQP
jgi:rhodanese-related sulfurtransferase